MANRVPVVALQTLFLAWAIFGCLARVQATGDGNVATQSDALATALTGGESSVLPYRRQLSEPVQREALAFGTCPFGCFFGTSCCSGFCFNLQIDVLHCGSCTKVCPIGNFCCSGTCASLLKDPNNCGFCGHKCPSGFRCTLGFCNYGK